MQVHIYIWYFFVYMSRMVTVNSQFIAMVKTGASWSIPFLSFALNLKHKDTQNNTLVDVPVTFSELHALVLKGGTCEHQI